MITAVIQIGNSDNKLSQAEWAHYVADMRCDIALKVHNVHFTGGSDWDAPWQNACWVCEVTPEQVLELREALTTRRRNYRQDSVALTLGNTEFV